LARHGLTGKVERRNNAAIRDNHTRAAPHSPRQWVIEHEQHSVDTAEVGVQLPALYGRVNLFEMPRAFAPLRLSTLRRTVPEISARNAIDDRVLVACDFRTHIDFFAWYTSCHLDADAWRE
jgi:hypothetical protein